jgi:hypothetical protein
LITDALTVINYLTAAPLAISPSRIVIAGQSLGTAVAAGAVERFVFGSPSNPLKQASQPFAGIILFSPFTNLRILLDSYRFMGVLPPLLSPLIGYPRFKKYALDKIVDTWDTASRLARLTGVSPSCDAGTENANREFDLTILHASNDFQIPWREGKRAWEAAVGGANATNYGTFVEDNTSSDEAVEVKVWEKRVDRGERVKRVRWERFRYGGR